MNEFLRQFLSSHCASFGVTNNFWHAISPFGSEPFVVPTIIIVAIILYWLRGLHIAAVWAASCGACFLTILTLKMIFSDASSIVILNHHFQVAQTPSGHAGMSMVLYGGLAILAYQAKAIFTRLLALVFPAIVLLISASMFIAGGHYLVDLVLGWAIGGCYLVMMVWGIQTVERTQFAGAIARRSRREPT